MDSHTIELMPALAGCGAYHGDVCEVLRESDPQLWRLIEAEYARLNDSIQLLAAENQCSRAVLAALGSIAQHKTSEGFPGERLHGGSGVVDEIERLAVERAKRAFGARYANVQPHSGTTANQIVLSALLENGGRILSMGTSHGGHFSHGAEDSLTGRLFEVEQYFVDRDTLMLDYDAIERQARAFRPQLIICGASVYTRKIDFARFRRIADEAGAFLLADISHISALVIAGVHQSPLPHAHVVTTSTYKPGGPRGGLILMGDEFDTTVSANGRVLPLYEHVERATFPGFQGTPYLNNVAAKAVFFAEAVSQEYRERQFRVVENAGRLARNLIEAGFDVVTGRTDNHMVLVNVSGYRDGLTGRNVQRGLEQCGIVVDKCRLPYDVKAGDVAGGVRLGTPIVTRNGMGTAEMDEISDAFEGIVRNLRPVSERNCEFDEVFCREVREKTRELAHRFPMK